eukprot:m.6631 g.6631  ORF g.6631 m.6631 type:complete len:185 (-) comp2624_c0_seq1:126-680(-)
MLKKVAEANEQSQEQQGNGVKKGKKKESKGGEGKQMRVVLQKTLGVSLQVDNDNDEWVRISEGVIIFVAFLKGATGDIIGKTVTKLLNMKYCEGGSILSKKRDVLLVPQAPLGGKMKGRQLQYHDNINKDIGQELFQQLIEEFRQQIAKDDAEGEISFLHGTYGGIQRMKDASSDGPWTHTFDF